MMEIGYKGGDDNPIARNWLINNRGAGTWAEFSRLDRLKQWEIRKWIQALPYSYSVWDGEKHYMLAHAYPYHYDAEYSPLVTRLHRKDAVWRRLGLREDPFADYRGDEKYHCLICGHTITESPGLPRGTESSTEKNMSTSTAAPSFFPARQTTRSRSERRRRERSLHACGSRTQRNFM